jgi:hypothetical protein
VIAARKPTGTRASRAAQRRGIDHGIGVGHRDHATEPTRGGGPRTGLEILLVLLAGGAQMHVWIKERGQQPVALALDDLHPRARGQRQGRGDLDDLTTGNEDVVASVELGSRIEHVNVAQQNLSWAMRPVYQKSDAHQASCWKIFDRSETGDGRSAGAPANSS